MFSETSTSCFWTSSAVLEDPVASRSVSRFLTSWPILSISLMAFEALAACCFINARSFSSFLTSLSLANACGLMNERRQASERGLRSSRRTLLTVLVSVGISLCFSLMYCSSSGISRATSLFFVASTGKSLCTSASSICHPLSSSCSCLIFSGDVRFICSWSLLGRRLVNNRFTN